MKRFILISLIVAAALEMPSALAAGLTRADVIEHLVDLENVGYRSSSASSLRYPYDAEAAQERLAARNAHKDAKGVPTVGQAR
ncbi:DUF4148 domain-containing protein [Paraburkholderia sp. 22B1P]|uniref:DUF4148 domain-containing protein n=1 Tax=Paraburkholderia sp. 22B1P TaxID=3080498 RepID=UPI0030878534|nr:hypothetical protein PBP221_85990 [Paraburkholderia sp. 22B1P]